MLMLKNPVFYCRVKIPLQQFLIFLSFINVSSETVVRSCSSKSEPLKISQHPELKGDPNTFVFL